jgi:hypothetical protein
MCPSCGSPLTGDETFCLQCGTRLVPEPEPRPSWTVPAVIVGAIAVLAVGGVVFALERVESDAEREASEAVPVVEPATTAAEEPPTRVATWPEGDAAYTVVLATASDEASARARASAAVDGGVPAGILDSDEYPTLGLDAWVLFAGRYASRREAADEAGRYAAAGFPDAHPEFVSAEPPAG